MANALGWKIQEADAAGEEVAVTLAVLFYGSDVAGVGAGDGQEPRRGALPDAGGVGWSR